MLRRLQKWVQKELGATGYFGSSGTNLVASAVVSPIYVIVTNPLSRLEVIAPACERVSRVSSLSLECLRAHVLRQRAARFVAARFVDVRSRVIHSALKPCTRFQIASPPNVVASPLTRPCHRSQVIMQTNSIKGNSISTVEAIKEMGADMAKFGLSGVFRGQGIGIFKAIISLTLFHEGRLFLGRNFKDYNKRNGYMPK